MSYLYWGTVRDEGEVPGSERERSAAGPGWALAYHGAYELGGPQAVRAIPGGEQWLAVLDEQPEIERHLHVHLGHCIELNDADRAAWNAGGGALMDQVTVTGTADEVRRRLDALGEQGVTEAVYQPAGPDIRRELELMIAAAPLTLTWGTARLFNPGLREMTIASGNREPVTAIPDHRAHRESAGRDSPRSASATAHSPGTRRTVRQAQAPFPAPRTTGTKMSELRVLKRATTGRSDHRISGGGGCHEQPIMRGQ